MPSPSTAPRRIVVVLDGPPTPRWQQRALAELRARPDLEIADVRLLGAGRGRGVARRLHEAVERRLFALGPGALEPVALGAGELVGAGDAAELVVWVSESAPPDAAREPRELLHLRHGGRREPAEDAFRRAVLRGQACLETEALLRGTDGAVVLVERTVSGARPYSTTLSRDKALWKIAALLARAAARAPDRGEPAAPAPPAAPVPSTAELLVRSPWRWLRIVAARLLFERPWRVRVRERERGDGGGVDAVHGWARAASAVPVRWRDGHLYADPFLFEHEGRHHLFCEDLAPGARRAVISHVELAGAAGEAPAWGEAGVAGEGRAWGEAGVAGEGRAAEPVPAPVLQAQHHLSYPFVFAHDGEVFMIPETSAEQRVELYRAVEFPREWRREAVLLDGVIASDATLLAHDGRLWLFVGVAVPGATMLDELALFSAETLAGPWRAHPRNPIVSDVRCARPAGAIQRWGERLVRPAQDCSRRYGGAVTFREIDVLSLDDYAEHEIARLDPADLGARARAVHTYAADARFEAVDLRRRRLRLGVPSLWSRR